MIVIHSIILNSYERAALIAINASNWSKIDSASFDGSVFSLWTNARHRFCVDLGVMIFQKNPSPSGRYEQRNLFSF